MNWKDSAVTVLPIYKELLEAGLRLWVYRYNWPPSSSSWMHKTFSMNLALKPICCCMAINWCTSMFIGVVKFIAWYVAPSVSCDLCLPFSDCKIINLDWPWLVWATLISDQMERVIYALGINTKYFGTNLLFALKIDDLELWSSSWNLILYNYYLLTKI